MTTCLTYLKATKLVTLAHIDLSLQQWFSVRGDFDPQETFLVGTPGVGVYV